MLGAGFGFLKNSHVRIDFISTKLSSHARNWIDVIGIVFVLVPFCAIAGSLGWSFFYQALISGEMSQNAGDLVLLEAGNVVPADIRLIETHSLRIDEAALTGESVPAEKTDKVLTEEDLPIGDKLNLAFKSTLITNGRAKGVVIATGMLTEIGLIAKMLQQSESVTPLQKRMSVFQKTGFDRLLKDRILKDKVYLGSSAGAMVICRRNSKKAYLYIYGEEGEYGVKEYMDLVDFTIKPHMGSKEFPNNNPENLERVCKYLDFDCYGLRDDQAIIVEDGKISFVGGEPFKVAGTSSSAGSK